MCFQSLYKKCKDNIIDNSEVWSQIVGEYGGCLSFLYLNFGYMIHVIWNILFDFHSLNYFSLNLINFGMRLALLEICLCYKITFVEYNVSCAFCRLDSDFALYGIFLYYSFNMHIFPILLSNIMYNK